MGDFCDELDKRLTSQDRVVLDSLRKDCQGHHTLSILTKHSENSNKDAACYDPTSPDGLSSCL